MSTKVILLMLSIISFQLSAHSEDDPLLSMLKLSALELNAEEPKEWEIKGDYWLGKDLDKFWLKFELGSEFEDEASRIEEFELQALYSTAISAYWDLQLGVLHDFKKEQAQTWGVVGFQGLAPYWFEVDTALMLGANGELGARLEFEYELMLNQSWRLVPELELQLFGQNNSINEQGSGLSTASYELGLIYDVTRQFSLYTKYEKMKTFGKTADYLILEGEPSSHSEFKVGVSFWF